MAVVKIDPHSIKLRKVNEFQIFEYKQGLSIKIDNMNFISILKHRFTHPLLEADVALITTFKPKELMDEEIPLLHFKLGAFIKIEKIRPIIHCDNDSWGMEWLNEKQFEDYKKYMRRYQQIGYIS